MMNPGSPTGHILKEKTMSDTILAGVYVAKAPKGSPVKAASTVQPKSRWRRAKVRLGGFLGGIGEVLAQMDRGRQLHPVVSAYRR
jgi:hypothetical protein